MDKTKLEQLLEVQLIDGHDNWKCLCPFHSEKTPSFFIHKESYMCHCFGCGTRGWLDILIARKRQVPASDIRKILDIVPERVGFKEGHRSYERPTSFPESWLGAWPKFVHKSIIGRGFTTDIFKSAKARYDRNNARQVFPHYHDGILIGAAGRTCNGADPKWFFYWGYPKSLHLYQLPDKIQRIKPLYVVEGILDVLWLEQHGYSAVSLLGSKASKGQIREIKQFSSDVVIALDNDEAGEIGAEMLHDALKSSCNIRYASLPIHANDVCDLSERELKEALQKNTLTKLEKLINVEA